MNAEEHGYGAEELFAVDGGGARDAGEDGGLEVAAFADHALAAGKGAGSGFFGGLHLGFEMLDGLGGGEGAEVGGVFEWVAYAEGFHSGDEAGFEVVVDGVVDDEALGGDAGLTVVDGAGADGGFDGQIEVGGGHDEEGIAAA